MAGAVAAGVGVLGIVACLVLEPAGWLAPAASLLAFGVGAVWLAVGVLGQYLGRVYLQTGRGWPSFVVHRGPASRGDPS